MPELAVETDASKPEARQRALSKRPDSASHLGHNVWSGVRGFIAELLSFPITAGTRNGALIVKAQLPGLRKDEIKVTVSDVVLVIEAEPNREKEGPFRPAGRRLIPVPDRAEIDLTRAELKNGVLTVWVPTPSKSQRQVPVEEGDDTSVQIEPL